MATKGKDGFYTLHVTSYRFACQICSIVCHSQETLEEHRSNCNDSEFLPNIVDFVWLHLWDEEGPEGIKLVCVNCSGVCESATDIHACPIGPIY
jgi:hypothetical protein